jgi:DNA-binding transcriptional MerR regulator
MTTGDRRWTISELGERVSAALEQVEYARPANGQVRAVPDLRTIRYYTTLGLLDRPSAMRGRTALYGPRHLLQLVAVKRLQADGKSLGEIQAALSGLDDRGLAAIAGVSIRQAREIAVAAEEQEEAEPAAEAGRADPAARASFWAAAPAPVAVSATADRPAPDPIDPAPAALDPGALAPLTMTAMTRIDLAPGVFLVLEAAGAGGALQPGSAPIDPAELARAAAPLLAALRRHGLAREDHEQETP